MILSHFSKHPFEFDSNRQYVQESATSGLLKPSGFWLSDESDFGWREWCVGEAFHMDHLSYQSDFKAKMSDLLWLKTSDDIIQFTQEFYQSMGPSLSLITTVDWPQVIARYKGILITPYNWAMRMDERCFWYYGWDCASACIWDLSCLELQSVTKTKLQEKVND